VEQLHQQVLPSADPLDWQRVFARAVRAVMTADAERRLIFLFDQFDEVYKALHPRFFANLRAIRDQHKYRISFVTFTRDVLPRISQCPESEEFYELLSPNIIGLGPYDYDDSWGLLHRVAGRYGLAPDHALGDRLTALTGGHPGLLKAAYMATMRDNLTLPETDPEAIQTLLDKADVRTECLKLWDSIGEDEREVLSDIAGGFRLLESERDAFQLLKLKGLVTEGDDNRVSIPCGLLNVFVADFAPAKARDLKLDERSGRVWVEGKAVEELTPLELALLCHLYERPGEVCTRDEIICALYPEELEDLNAEISNSRVDTLIARLREKIEPDHNRPRYIITVRGRGYKLSGVS